MHIDNDDECTVLLYARQKVVAVDEPVDGEDEEEGVGEEREGNGEGGGGREYVAREEFKESQVKIKNK